MKKSYKVLIVIGILVLLLFIFIFSIIKKTTNAVANIEFAAIDMEKVDDGTYKAQSTSGIIDVIVEVTVKDHKISDINLVKHTNGKGKPAEAILDEMVKNNTDDVDVVSGATMSSKTIRSAVNKALQKGMEE